MKDNQHSIEFKLDEDEFFLRVGLSKNSINRIMEKSDCGHETHMNAIGNILSIIVMHVFIKEADIDKATIEELDIIRNDFEDFFIECIELGLMSGFEKLKMRKLQ